jgi:hypothetical protein
VPRDKPLNSITYSKRPNHPAHSIASEFLHDNVRPVAGFSVGRRRPSPSPALVHLRKRLSSSTVRPSSCHHVRICTDRERPTPKSARSKQRTYQQRKHSKKWREAGSYWPSKWNGLTGRSLPFATKKVIAHCANKSAPGRRRFGKWKKIIWSSRAHQLLAPPASGTMTTMTCSPSVVGLIMKAAASPAGTPWLWTLAFGHHEDRTPHPRICRNPRGRHGSVREELAAEARSLGKIGHHDQDAPQRDQHSKPERGGPYYQTHVHYSM